MGKTERCLFMVLATAFPVIMPVLLMQLVNGSLITTVLRLRAARRELAAKEQEQPRVEASEATGNHFAEYFDAVTQPLYAVTRPLIGVAA
jgi:CDP-diacylglycerol--glycerol-3-phosphate 3-phosphatidyltransferase